MTVLLRILGRAELAPIRLELEVTETVLRTMHALQALGISITLDDFGTGHANLSYLQRFPFERIKLDKSFIRYLRENPQSGAIVETVLLLSRRLELNVVAEGVETEAQIDVLCELGCPLVQGFLKGRPMLAKEARNFGEHEAIG